MKALNQVFNRSFKFEKLLHWSRLIVLTGSTQLLVQGIGLISGIIIIRLLPTREYALYTLVNTMLGTMTVLSDGGISAGVMAQGGRVWRDADKLGSVLVTGLELRKKFAVFSLLISTPILLILLFKHGATWPSAILMVLALIPAFAAALSDSLLEIGPKLWQDIKKLQLNQAFVGIFRLLMIGSVYLFPWAAVAIISSGIPRIIGNFKLRKISSSYVNWDRKPDEEVKKEILSVVKRILPGSIYYCISGQITIFIISIFGNTTAIAHAGALSRLAMVLTVFSVVSGTIITPRYARIQNNSKLLLSRYVQIQLILLFFSISLIGLVSVFPSQILWILGKDYSNLKIEVVLSVAVSCINLIAGVCFSLNTSRGWAIRPVISISVNVLSIIIGVIFIDVSKLTGVLLLNMFVGLIDVAMYLIYTFNQIRLLKLSEKKNLVF